MNLTELESTLFKLRDTKYAEFAHKLTPGISRDSFIGVKVPVLREFAKKATKNDDFSWFLNSLPHKYYDENILHSLIISNLKDYDQIINEIDKFLPYIDNWAVCDLLSPKYLGKHKEKLIEKIKVWCKSKDTFTCRFGMEMLMTFYLDDDFKKEYLDIPSSIKSEEYYVNMMIAWFFATALAKQWETTISIIESKRLNPWVHNKTIQKARESYRITTAQKEYLKSLKVGK